MIDPVYVYKWSYWDEESGSQKTSTLYALRELILAGLVVCG